MFPKSSSVVVQPMGFSTFQEVKYLCAGIGPIQRGSYPIFSQIPEYVHMLEKNSQGSHDYDSSPPTRLQLVDGLPR